MNDDESFRPGVLNGSSLAIKLAVDAGEYERAAAVLDVLRGTTSACTVTPIGAVREQGTK